MKKFKFLVLSSLLSILLISCEKDEECLNTTCQNGGTLIIESCTCDCPAGYTGAYCQNEPQPTGYKITRIEIVNMPQCLLNGNPIDEPPDDPQPDIRIQLVHSSVTYTSGIDYGASQVDFDNLNWIVNSNTGESDLKIYDIDNLGAVSTTELLLTIGFNFSDLEDDSNGIIGRQINEAFSSDCYPGSVPAYVRFYFDLID